MTRIVITGYGIVSSLGNNKAEVCESLRQGRSGIVFSQAYADLGMRSRVHGAIDIDAKSIIDRKLHRFMGDAAAYSYIAMGEAIEHAGLPGNVVSSERTGLLLGTGGASPENIVSAADTLRQRGIRRVGPYMVTKTMASTITACVGTALKIKGVSYAISSACATSAHCIGHGAELIELGKQDVVFAGGGEELHWTLSVLFDGMGAMSSNFNDSPTTASRPYDRDRDGFVISGGAGVVVLESLEHAEKRGAPIIAELVGYGATSDGFDMVQPSGEGAVRCMRQALRPINGHDAQTDARPKRRCNTSTPTAPARRSEMCANWKPSPRSLAAARRHGQTPLVGSTKSLSGHALGAAGVNEAIYTLLMMEGGFIAASANIENLDPAAAGHAIVTERQDDVDLRVAMSNSFGFGGTNSALVFKRWAG